MGRASTRRGGSSTPTPTPAATSSTPPSIIATAPARRSSARSSRAGGIGSWSGKFTRPGGTTDVTRVSANSISTHDHTVAQAVQDLADQLGATPSQVALAWTMTRSTAVHPIVGVRRLDQLLDNLGALDLSLTPEAVEQLEATTAFDIGFPNDFIRDMQSFVYGEVGARVDEGRR